MSIKKRVHGFNKFIGEILIPEILAIYGALTADFLSRLLKICIRCLVLCMLWKALCKSMQVIDNKNNK